MKVVIIQNPCDDIPKHRAELENARINYSYDPYLITETLIAEDKNNPQQIRTTLYFS